MAGDEDGREGERDERPRRDPHSANNDEPIDDGSSDASGHWLPPHRCVSSAPAGQSSTGSRCASTTPGPPATRRLRKPPSQFVWPPNQNAQRRVSRHRTFGSTKRAFPTRNLDRPAVGSSRVESPPWVGGPETAACIRELSQLFETVRPVFLSPAI